MVSTRSARKKEEASAAQSAKMQEEQCKIELPEQPTAQTKSKKSASSKSSIIKQKRLLELKAEEEKAHIKMMLIDKKLAVDLADLDAEGSSCSTLSKELKEKENIVEKWLESSQQEINQRADAEPADDAVLETARPSPPAQACGGTYDTVHTLASALKDLAAFSATNACGGNEKLLNRMCTPRDLPSYSGDPLQWLEFKRAYEESSQVCNFSDRENLWRLRRSLHGPAKDAVTALLIGATSPDEVMSTLELQFGNPDVIVSRILQDIYKLRQLPQDYQKDIIPFSIKVKNCVAAVLAIGCEYHLQGTNVISVILSKLPSVLISKWTDYSYPVINKGIKPKLVILSEFLNEEAVKITKTFVSLQTFNKQSYSGYNDNRYRAQTLFVNNKLGNTGAIMNDYKNNKCGYCRDAVHSLPECRKFKKSLRKDRWAYVKRYGVCYKCLKSRHKQNTCPEPVCDIDNCGLAHHRLLHYTTNVNKSVCNNDSINITEKTDTDSRVETVTHINTNSCKVLLKIVPVCLHGPSGVVRSVALLDDGSTVTLISDRLASRLGLRGCKQSMRVCGPWDNSEVVCDSEIVDLDISNKSGTMFSIRARCVKNLNLPVQNISAADFGNYELKPEMKDIISIKQCTPELLIGQDNYELLLPLEVVGGGASEPYFTRSPLGWCIHGCLRTSYHVGTSPESALLLSGNEVFTNVETQHILEDMHEEMRRSFTIESMGVSPKPRHNKEDVQACEYLERTARLVDGRWYVGLPWKQINCKMPDSYPNAVARLKGVERKMKAIPGYAERYTERIKHLFENDYAVILEETQKSQSSERIWYLPHFGVDNPNKQKLRLVFDAAARSGGMCLNDYLQKGPDLLTSLYGILLRFRENKIAVTADIKDMFLQIKVLKEDSNALRFLWRQSPDQPITTYAMSSLLFGAKCSPFVAQFVKNKNAERYESSMPQAVHAICKQHYMDDYIDSVEDEQLACKLVNDITYIHKQGGFEIRNWVSNNQSILNCLQCQPSQIAVSLKDGQQYEGERTLGLIWRPSDDTLGFDVSFKRIPAPILTGTKKPTKREMLRVLMSIFDVYGFLSPITIKGKIILQDIWRIGISWDEEIPEAIFPKWIDWLHIVKNMNIIHLPRHYASAANRSTFQRTARAKEIQDYTCDVGASAPNNEFPPPANVPTAPCTYNAARYTNLQIHVFSDSSAKAMCAVAYWRWTDAANKQIQVAFISSKCRVAPVKYVSMPRLELQAAVMAARLLDSLVKEHRIKPTKRYLWCDSSTVLHWVRNDARNYKTYVAHRLGEIDELTSMNEWRYIPTKLNVADIATRDSCNIEMLQNEWLYGPTFLCQDEHLWPVDLDEQQPDIRKLDSECLNILHFRPTYLPAVPDPERFSSWLRLLRSTFMVLHFIEKIRKVTSDTKYTLMERAELLLLKYSQMKSFPDDLRRLEQNKRLDKKSKLFTLSPKLDDDGILRLEGRIDAAPGISTDVQRPIILDGRCHVTRLIVKHYHKKACHGNNEMVVNEIKQRYWVIRLRPTVKHVSSQCMLCRLRKAQPQPPRMGDLPKARMSHHQRVFTYTGLDLFGPIEVTIGRRRERRYGVIFTCLTVRAIHIELVSQLTTDALIMALRRMAARRGWPRYLYSDNGTNLRGADTELKRCVQELDEMKLKDEIMNYSSATTWTFIPPASPHWGGAWERLIRNIKTALKVILKERAPREETLLTLMTEVEHMVNSRPLTHVTVEPGSEESLTPNHFLLGTSSGLPTLGRYSSTDTYLRRQWRISQQLADMFWKRWVREVLPDMRPRSKWHSEERPLQVGDLVLIIDPNSPRNVWPRGRIQAVFPGNDGRIRVVELRTKSRVLRRSATRVARIPTGVECCTSTGEGSVGDA